MMQIMLAKVPLHLFKIVAQRGPFGFKFFGYSASSKITNLWCGNAVHKRDLSKVAGVGTAQRHFPAVIGGFKTQLDWTAIVVLQLAGVLLNVLFKALTLKLGFYSLN